MSTSAGFFIGAGKNATFLLAHYSDGYPDGLPKQLLLASSEDEFRNQVKMHAATVNASDLPIDLAHKQWPTKGRYCYTYAFFGGHVWITSGGRWFNPYIRAKRPMLPPPPPVARKGEIEGKMTITCGECCYSESVTFKQLVRWSSKKVVRVAPRELFSWYFESKGFTRSQRQGWLCSRCSPKTADIKNSGLRG